MINRIRGVGNRTFVRSNKGVTTREAKFNDWGQWRVTRQIQSMFKLSDNRAINVTRLHFAVVFALIAVLLALGGSPARADSGSASIEAVFGTAVEVRPPDAIVVASNSGLVTLTFDSDSELKIDSNIAAVADVVEGDRVVSTARRNTDGDLVALKTIVRVANSQPVTKHVVGIVTDSSDDELSVQARNGDVVLVVIPAGIEVPQVGDGITLVARLDRSSGVMTAIGFELTSKTVERLEDARDRAADQAEAARLSRIAIDARSKVLSTLDGAARALQRIIKSENVDQATLDQATAQVNEIQRRFNELKRIYDQAARDRNEELPVLAISGALVEEISATSFTIVPRGEQDADPFSVIFSFDPGETTVVLPPALQKLVTGDAESPQLLADVAHLIDPGSELDVKYSIDDDTRLAVSVIVRTPRLYEELEAVLDSEAHRAFHGVITLVEIDDSLEDALGIVIAANDQRDIKVAAKVTDETEVTLNGEAADISSLATGQAVDIQFESANVGSLADITASGATLRALAIRARSSAPSEEDHISGIVESVDTDDRAITIRPTDGSPIRLIVGDDVPLIRNGQRVQIGDISEGDLVVDATRTDPDSDLLTRLVVVSGTNVKFKGTVTGIGRELARLLVTGENGRAVNVLVTDETWVILDSRRVPFDDLTTGLSVVNGVYSVAGRDGAFYNVASVVSVESPKVGRAAGVIINVDVVSGTLSILSGKSTETRLLELRLPEYPLGDNMQKDGLPIRSLLDVERGDRVDIVLYVIGSGKIEKLSVVSDNFVRSRGTLLGVSPNLRFLQVELVSGEVFDLWVGPGSTLKQNGRTVESLADVAALLERARTADPDAAALVPSVLFIRDSVDSMLGVIISIQIQVKLESEQADTSPERADTVVELKVSGVIEAIRGQTWVVDGHVFRVDDRTELYGEVPEVGLVAQAALVSRAGGMFVAQVISVAGDPKM